MKRAKMKALVVGAVVAAGLLGGCQAGALGGDEVALSYRGTSYTEAQIEDATAQFNALVPESTKQSLLGDDTLPRMFTVYYLAFNPTVDSLLDQSGASTFEEQLDSSLAGLKEASGYTGEVSDTTRQLIRNMLLLQADQSGQIVGAFQQGLSEEIPQVSPRYAAFDWSRGGLVPNVPDVVALQPHRG